MRNENEYNYRTSTSCESVPTPKEECGWIFYDNKCDRLELITIFIPQYNKVCKCIVEEKIQG